MHTEVAPAHIAAQKPGSARLNHGIWVVCDSVGDIIEFWGFKRVLGRVWTLLYLSPTSLSAVEIGSNLELSTGAVSMALKEMEHWGIVLRETRPGTRQFFYTAEIRLWRMFGRVVRNRELHQIERLLTALKVGITTLQQAEKDDISVLGGENAHRFASLRLKKLSALVELGGDALRVVFQEKNLDLAAIQKIAQIRSLFQKSDEGDRLL